MGWIKRGKHAVCFGIFIDMSMASVLMFSLMTLPVHPQCPQCDQSIVSAVRIDRPHVMTILEALIKAKAARDRAAAEEAAAAAAAKAKQRKPKRKAQQATRKRPQAVAASSSDDDAEIHGRKRKKNGEDISSDRAFSKNILGASRMVAGQQGQQQAELHQGRRRARLTAAAIPAAAAAPAAAAPTASRSSRRVKR